MDAGRLRKMANALVLAFLYSPLTLFNLFVTPLLRDRRRFMDPAEYPQLSILQENVAVIRAELDQLVETGAPIPGFADVDDGQTRLAMDGKWKTYIFRVYGRDVAENWERCPQTAKLLQDIPDIFLAMFSILEPGKRLSPHFGAYRGVLRYHLPLVVPDPELCAVSVGGEVRHMQEGEALLFDDVFLHSAWNDSDADRVVLFIDIERRMPYAWLTALNRWILGFLSRRRRVRNAAKKAVVTT